MVADTEKTNLLNLDRAAMREFFASLDEKPFRAEQVMKWIYHHLEDDFEAMTDLGKNLRHKLAQVAFVGPPATLHEKTSDDATAKWLLGMNGGNAIETVYIPEPSRGTLCVSSQVGCALNCTFCSTATQGFNRNLSTAEIIGQVWVAAKQLGNVPHQARRITNVVMMGMGEPLANFDNVVAAMDLMRDDFGFGLANRRVTLSTSGMVPEMYKLADVSDVALAVSLHAGNDELRTQLVPLNKRYPIREVMEACQYYLSTRPRGSITFEYTLMKGVNDQPEHARELVKLMRRLPSKVNLIPFNPYPGARYERPDEADISAFQKVLNQADLVAPVRRTRGDDIDAACGQLKGQVVDRTRRQAQFREQLREVSGHAS